MHRSKPLSFNDLVCTGEQSGWHVEAECLGGLEIDDQFELGRRLHRQVGGRLTAQDAVDIGRRLPILLGEVGGVGHETAGRHEETERVDCGQAVPGRQRNDEIAMQMVVLPGGTTKPPFATRAKESMARSMSAAFSTPRGTISITSDGPGALITVWFALRILPGPPRSLSNLQISRRRPRSPQLAGSCGCFLVENHRPFPQSEPRLEGAGFCHLRMSDSDVPLR